jgi:hypothetical protein
LTRNAWSAVGGNKKAVNSICFVGDGGLPLAYPVTNFASAVTATAALAVLELLEKRTGQAHTATVDHRLASFWFGLSIHPIGWKLSPAWGPIAGDYPTRDGLPSFTRTPPHHLLTLSKQYDRLWRIRDQTNPQETREIICFLA